MTRYGDGHFLPVEQPAGTPDIQILLEGKQIALVIWNPEPLPRGVGAVGFELTTSEVMVVMAVPVDERGYNVRLFWRWIPAQRIWTKRMDRRARHGRVVIPGEAEADRIQRQIEGEVIRGVIQIREPNSAGGEQSMLELRNGTALHFNALPDRERSRPRFPAAELDLEVKDAVNKLIFLPTSRS